ncbi:hypothetical protein GCM10010124_01370 [Pilimelia terevasa]|uniref:Pyrrolo-quinoline quinone repeat domain-containing protein n=1 Tax=Pilimelia terevasa TaxID=53372 RepID=A0A8J3FH36_9ACTN|nr:PQQ-binding-like beta-propeller repeat protein [Pilimelia terevasa]GGK12582.1 hypothetical protein GCM10010124_01370 [Pilimelia terevasa]
MDDGSTGRRPRVRGPLAVLLACALLAGLGALAAYRTLRPAEVLTLARGPYPAGPTTPLRGYGRFADAPLFVGEQVRVYANKYQVKADGPGNQRFQASPYWSLRRWPQQVLGVVVAAGRAVTRWSDGELTATDVRSGAVAWRQPGPAVPAGARYTGRRDGAGSVYAPDGMHTAADTVIVRGRTETVAYDPAGAVRWREPAGACPVESFTTTDGRYAVVRGCGPETVEFRDPRTGRLRDTWAAGGAVTPLACAPARSACVALRVARPGAPGPRGEGWLLAAGRPARAAGLDNPGALAMADGRGQVLAATLADGAVVVGPAAGGPALWRWRAPAVPVRPDPATAALLGIPPGVGGLRPGTPLPGIPAAPPGRPGAPRELVVPGAPAVRHLLASHADSLYVVTAQNRVAELDTRTGALRAGFTLDRSEAVRTWVPGWAVAGPHLVAFEQLRAGVPATRDDAEYYLSGEPVIVAGPFYNPKSRRIE